MQARLVVAYCRETRCRAEASPGRQGRLFSRILLRFMAAPVRNDRRTRYCR